MIPPGQRISKYEREKGLDIPEHPLVFSLLSLEKNNTSYLSLLILYFLSLIPYAKHVPEEPVRKQLPARFTRAYQSVPPTERECAG